VVGITRGAGLASRVLRAVGSKIPGLSGESVEHAILEASRTFSLMARDKRILFWSLVWASLNWLLDAASLWCFVAAFGHTVNPVELFAAYGIANVAGALPISPGGLGVVDSIAPLLLVGFGVTRSVATLGVIGWRLVNFWLPIPTGAAAYVSLRVSPGPGRLPEAEPVEDTEPAEDTEPVEDAEPDADSAPYPPQTAQPQPQDNTPDPDHPLNPGRSWSG
jgi:hypothetical protein